MLRISAISDAANRTGNIIESVTAAEYAPAKPYGLAAQNMQAGSGKHMHSAAVRADAAATDAIAATEQAGMGRKSKSSVAKSFLPESATAAAISGKRHAGTAKTIAAIPLRFFLPRLLISARADADTARNAEKMTAGGT